jgi:hypothetical protein
MITDTDNVAVVRHPDHDHPASCIGKGTNLPAQIGCTRSLELGGKTLAQGDKIFQSQNIHENSVHQAHKDEISDIQQLMVLHRPTTPPKPPGNAGTPTP